MAHIEGIKPPFIPAGGLERQQQHQPIITSDGKRFGEILKEKLDSLAKETGIKFSAHAQSRISSRNIDLSSQDLKKMADAIDRAEKKGAKETLILLEENAFIVNVKNKTVITAVDKESLDENVFTKIDSAVIVRRESEAEIEEENQLWFPEHR